MGFYKNSKKTQQKLDDEEYKKYRETLLPFETAKYEALSADYNNIRKAYTDGSDGNYHDSAYYDSFKQHFNNLEERRKKLELDFKTNLTEDYSKNYLTALNNLSTDLYSLENHRKNKSYYFSQFKNDDSYTNFINTQKFDGKSFADVMAEYEKSDDKTKSWLDENKYNYMTLDELKTEKEKLSGKQNLKDKINNFSNKLYDKFGGDVNNTYRKKTNNQSYETSKNENTDDYYENKYKLRKINQLIQSKATEEKVDSLDNDTLSAIDKYNEATTKRKNANIGQFISVLAPNNAVNSYGNKNTDYINAHTEASKDMEMAIANIQNLHPDWNKSKIEELSYLRKQQLEAKESERFKNEVKEMTNKNPIMGAIWGRIANPVGGIASTAKTVKQLAENTINKKKYGFDYGVDPNSAIYAIKDSGQVADQTNMEKYNKEIKLFGKNGKTIDLYDLAYQVATGTADNLVRVGLAGGSSTGAGAIMLAQAFADGFTEKKKYGYSDKDAFISGSIQATIEGLTEKYSIETILDQKKAKSIFGALGKAFVAEGSEEVVGNLANRLVDLIDNGEYSEIVKNVRQYQKKGMSGNKALGQAFLDMIGEDTEAMVVGGLSGALMGAGYQINGSIQRGENKVKNKLDNINAIDLYRKNLIKDNAEYKAFAKQQGDENLFNNYDNALTKYKENTKNRKNKRELNSAAKDLAKSVRVNVSEQTKSVFNNTLKSELESAGVTEEQKNAVDKWINNKMLSEFDVSEINKLDENVLNNAVKKANGEMDYVSSKITMDAIKESKGKTVPNITAYHTVLDTPNSGTGAVIEYNGENVSINSFADVKQGKVNLNNGNTVNLSDVEMSSDTATIIEGVRSLADRYKLENDKATVLLTLAKDTIGTGVRADDIALALDDAFIYGTLGAEKFLNNSIFIKSTIKNPIVANAIKAAYDIGFNISNIVKSHDSDISAKIAVKKNFNNNKVKFEGGLENTLKSYSIEQRTEAAIVNRLSKDVFSNDIVIFDSRKTENSKLKNKNGAFRSKDGSIWIDINAEQGLLGALSHELTHFMKSLNNAKFKEIANILIDEYGKARVPLEDVIKDYMNKLDCSRELAFEEYVCDCMTKMLSDTNAAETLARLRIADRKIADGFIKYIHKAIDGIKAFLKNKDDKQFGNLTLQLNQLQQISDLWAEGVAGAMTEFENKQKKNTALDNDGEIKYSIAENTESDIDKLLNNKYYRDEIKLSNTTPSIMLAQKGVKNLPLIMNAGHIRENILTEDEARQKGFKISNKIHYHGLGKELFLKIFDELENTKLAYRGTKNASNPTRRENYFLLISEIKDEKNNIINVPVYINEKTKSNNVFIDVNKAATAYGKANFNKYIDNQLKSGNLVRIKNNRPSEWTESLPADYRSVVDNNTLPHTSEKVKVENENAEKFSKKGENKYGIEVYETSEEVKKLTWKERIKQYKNLMENMFYGRTARFNRNGHIYYAQFDKDSTDKILYGEKGLSTKGKKAIIKAGADGDVFNVVENAKYDHSGKDLKNHKSKDNFTDYFDYFYKTVQIDNGVYDIIINVKKQYGTDNGYTYTIKIDDNYKIKAAPTLTDENQLSKVQGLYSAAGSVKSDPTSANNKIPHLNTKVNNKNENNEKFSMKSTVEETKDLIAVHNMDSNGNILTRQQEKYFKNSKVRNKDGQLLVVYHGTEKDFNIFDFSKVGKNGTSKGYGFYFSDNKETVRHYGENIKTAYLDIENPLYNNKITLKYTDVKNLVNALISDEISTDDVEWQDTFISNYFYTYDGKSKTDFIDKLTNKLFANNSNDMDIVYELVNTTGSNYNADSMSKFYKVLYNTIKSDGNIIKNKDGTNIFVVFFPNKVKYISNANPSVDLDMRFSEKTDGNNKKYWKIEETKDVLKGLKTVSEYEKAAFDYILGERDRKTVIHAIDGKEMSFIRLSAEEFTNSRESRNLKNNNSKQYIQKMRMIPSLQDIVSHASVNWKSQDLKSHKLFKENGFENYRGRVGIDNVIFNYVVRAGKTSFGDVFYDINLEVDQFLPHTKSASEIKKGSTSENNISLNSENVKPDLFSTKEIRTDIDVDVAEEYIKINRELEKENAKLKELVKLQRERARQHGKITNGKIVRPSSISAQAVLLKKQYGISGIKGNTELEALLKNYYDYVIDHADTEDITLFTLEKTMRQAKPVSDWIISKIEDKNQFNSAYDELNALNDIDLERSITADVYNSYWNVSTLHTVADKYQSKINELKLKHNTKVKELQERERSTIKKYQEMRKKSIARRKKTATKEKVISKYYDLYKKLVKPTKEKNIPMEYQYIVKDLLSSIDINSSADGERGNTTREKLATEKYALDKTYISTQARAAVDDVIQNRIDNIKEIYNGKTLKDLTQSEIEYVNDTLKAVSKTIRDAHRLFINNKQFEISSFANKIISDLRKVKKIKKNRFEKVAGIDTNSIKSFTYDLFKPEYFFRYLGSDEFLEVFENARKGDDVFSTDIREATELCEALKEKYNTKKWNFEKTYNFNLGGNTVNLKLSEIMSLYAYSKRKQADLHLQLGGFVLPSSVKKYIGKTKISTAEIERINEEGIKIQPAELERVINILTFEQKAFVARMQKYLSSDMAAKGNETSRALYDIELFNEKNYFPLKIAKELKPNAENTTKDANIPTKLKNLGMTKSTVKNATSPIILDGFLDVWTQHISEMSMYHAYTQGIETLEKVFNYKDYNAEENSATLQSVIQSHFGKPANSYIRQFIADLNGGLRGYNSQMMKLANRTKKVAVGASLSTAIQQPTAIIRAQAYINPVHFLKQDIHHKQSWEELKKYAPIAQLKEMNGIDMGSGRTASNYLMSIFHTSLGEKIDDASMWLAGKGDEFGWNMIWNAVKNEQRNMKKSLSESEFLRHCGKRFTDVVSKTQVYDSVFTRSGLMRSKSELNKMATSFMGEPSTTLNMFIDAIIQAKRKKISKGTAVRIMSNTFLASVLAVVFKSLIAANRDDDNEKDYTEKYITSFTRNLLDELNPMNLVPYLRDIATLIEGFDVERMDMSLISSVVEGVKIAQSDNAAPFKKIEKLAGSFGNLTGVPIGNVLRTAREIYNFAETTYNTAKGKTREITAESIGETFKKNTPFLKENSTKNLNKYLAKGNTEKAKEMADKLVAQKVSEGKTEKEAKGSVKSALTAKWKDKYLNANTKEQAEIRKKLYATGVYDKVDDVIKMCNDWEKKNTEKNNSTNKTKKK